MCNCGSTCLGNCSIDLTGIGQVGATGAQGEYGGYSSVWNFSTTTTSGTTAGQLRFNSGTYASVTTMYINKTNQDSTDLSNFLATLSNGTYYGKIRIFKESDSSKFWEGTITNVSSGASEYTLTVSYILANSTFSASDSVVLSFTPHGLGAKPILFSFYGQADSGTTGSWVDLTDTEFTIPAGLLTTDGDYIEVIGMGHIGRTGSPLVLNGIRGMINSDALSGSGGYLGIAGGELFHGSGSNGPEFELTIKIERYDATNVITYYKCLASSEYPLVGTSFSGPVNNLGTLDNTFKFQIYNGDGVGSVQITSAKAIKYLQ